MKYSKQVFLLLLSVLAFTASAAEPHWPVGAVDDAEVEAAAQAALAELGPDRGAVLLMAGFDGGEIYIEGSDKGGIPILGLGEGIAGVPLDLQGLVSDLDADVTGYGYKISLSGDLLFDFDKDSLKQVALETLQKVVLLAKKEQVGEIKIEGHTDSKGSEEYNQILSERRAKSVENWLVDSGGIDASVIHSIGLGESQPVAVNSNPDGSDNPEGRAQNRRVDIYIKKNN